MKSPAVSFLRSPFSAIAAVVAGAMLLAAQPTMAQTFPISKAIDSNRVDFKDSAQVHALYGKLINAADDVCGNTWRVGLEPVAHPDACRERALGDAVRRVNRQSLTLVYLSQHTLLQAQQYGIVVPSSVASN